MTVIGLSGNRGAPRASRLKALSRAILALACVSILGSGEALAQTANFTIQVTGGGHVGVTGTLAGVTVTEGCNGTSQCSFPYDAGQTLSVVLTPSIGGAVLSTGGACVVSTGSGSGTVAFSNSTTCTVGFTAASTGPIPFAGAPQTKKVDAGNVLGSPNTNQNQYTVITPSFSTSSNSQLSSVALSISTPPTHGSVKIATCASGSGSCLQYTPTSYYVGADSFSYTASNSVGTSAPATVTMTVVAAGPPAAVSNNQTVVNYMSAVPLNISQPAATWPATGIAVTKSPTQGIVTSYNYVALSYTPNKGFSGSDSVSFNLLNTYYSGSAGSLTSKSGSTAGAVAIFVADPPPLLGTLAPITVASGKTATITLPVIQGTIANLTGSITSTTKNITPTGLSVTCGTSSCTISYTATTVSQSNTAQDIFCYQLKNASGAATGCVTVNITPTTPSANAITVYVPISGATAVVNVNQGNTTSSGPATSAITGVISSVSVTQPASTATGSSASSTATQTGLPFDSFAIIPNSGLTTLPTNDTMTYTVSNGSPGALATSKPANVTIKYVGPRPQTGWYYDPNQPGQGFSVEWNPYTDTIKIGVFAYRNKDGSPVWFTNQKAVSVTADTDPGAPGFSLTLDELKGLCDLTSTSASSNSTTTTPGCLLKSDSPTNSVSATLSYTAATATTAASWWLSLSQTSGTLYGVDLATAGVSFPLSRFPISANTPAPNYGAPAAGWYFNAAMGGTGYFFEQQANRIFLVGYLYQTQVLSTTPTSQPSSWYYLMTDNVGAYTQGPLYQASYGEKLGDTANPVYNPVISNVGPATLNITAPSNNAGTSVPTLSITLPGQTTPITLVKYFP